MRGAWIERVSEKRSEAIAIPSLPVRGAWIESISSFPNSTKSVSLPVRGAWIESMVD